MLCGLLGLVIVAGFLSSIQNEDVMKQQKWIVAGIFLAGVCAAAMIAHPVAVVSADDAKPAPKPEPWKAEDVIFQEFAGQMRISPAFIRSG
jgi:hypothetical protein